MTDLYGLKIRLWVKVMSQLILSAMLSWCREHLVVFDQILGAKFVSKQGPYVAESVINLRHQL